MYFIWVARGLYSSMITMFTVVYLRLYDKKNGDQQDNSWYVYIHTANALKSAQIIILSYHISQKSNFASYFLSVHGKMTHIAIGPGLRKPVFGDL